MVRDAEIINVPLLAVLAGCSARRSECCDVQGCTNAAGAGMRESRVARHISEGQRRNAPASAVKNGMLVFSASLITYIPKIHSAN